MDNVELYFLHDSGIPLHQVAGPVCNKMGIPFLFPELKQTLEIGLLVAAPTLWNSLPVSVKSVGNITLHDHMNIYLVNHAYPPP